MNILNLFFQLIWNYNAGERCSDGLVTKIADGVVTIRGLEDVTAGEMLEINILAQKINKFLIYFDDIFSIISNILFSFFYNLGFIMFFCFRFSAIIIPLIHLIFFYVVLPIYDKYYKNSVSKHYIYKYYFGKGMVPYNPSSSTNNIGFEDNMSMPNDPNDSILKKIIGVVNENKVYIAIGLTGAALTATAAVIYVKHYYIPSIIDPINQDIKNLTKTVKIKERFINQFFDSYQISSEGKYKFYKYRNFKKNEILNYENIIKFFKKEDIKLSIEQKILYQLFSVLNKNINLSLSAGVGINPLSKNSMDSVLFSLQDILHLNKCLETESFNKLGLLYSAYLEYSDLEAQCINKKIKIEKIDNVLKDFSLIMSKQEKIYTLFLLNFKKILDENPELLFNLIIMGINNSFFQHLSKIGVYDENLEYLFDVYWINMKESYLQNGVFSLSEINFLNNLKTECKQLELLDEKFLHKELSIKEYSELRTSSIKKIQQILENCYIERYLMTEMEFKIVMDLTLEEFIKKELVKPLKELNKEYSDQFFDKQINEYIKILKVRIELLKKQLV